MTDETANLLIEKLIRKIQNCVNNLDELDVSVEARAASWGSFAKLTFIKNHEVVGTVDLE